MNVNITDLENAINYIAFRNFFKKDISETGINKFFLRLKGILAIIIGILLIPISSIILVFSKTNQNSEIFWIYLIIIPVCIGLFSYGGIYLKKCNRILCNKIIKPSDDLLLQVNNIIEKIKISEIDEDEESEFFALQIVYAAGTQYEKIENWRGQFINNTHAFFIEPNTNDILLLKNNNINFKEKKKILSKEKEYWLIFNLKNKIMNAIVTQQTFEKFKKWCNQSIL